MKTRRRTDTHFKLYMVRHGISCGNMNYHLKDELALGLYTDPELTQEGRTILQNVRRQMKQHIDGPYIVGASNLIRAQQTAQLLFNPKTIYIVPAIGEFGRHNQENTALRPSVQSSVFTDITKDASIIKKRNYSFFAENPSMTDVTQVSVFLEWLGTYYKKLAKTSKHPRPNVVLVSHYGFISELICSVKCLETNFLSNSALIEFDVSIVNEKARLNSVRQIHYIDDDKLKINIAKNLATDKCRIPLNKKIRGKTHKKGE